MTLIPSIKALRLDLPPSCIAFCPSQPRFFVVGTYFLHPKDVGSNISGVGVSEGDAGAYSIQQDDSKEDDSSNGQQVRSGSLILFRLEGDDTISRVVTKQTQYAILDLQWAPAPHTDNVGDLLAVASSTGLLALYRLDPRGEGDLVLSATKAVADPSILVLSLAWHPWRAHVIGITLSDGNVCFCESMEGDELWGHEAVVYQTTIHRHELEAWMLAFSGPNSTNVLSGGDDCVLQYSTINDYNERVVQWQDRKLNNAGVTAILPLTSKLVVTGSYDDHIRLIHMSQQGKRTVLAEKNLDGGVWRLKTLSRTTIPGREGSEPEITSLVILASCMHAGSRVVRLCKGENGHGDDSAWGFEVLARFEEHESMNYGADFQPGKIDGAGKRIVSISFYDKLMCLWRFEDSSS